MLETIRDFKEHAQRISRNEAGFVAMDFETTGLRARAGDKAFILGYSIGYTTGRHTGCIRLTGQDISEDLKIFCANESVYYLAHSATFELAFLQSQFGVQVKGKVWDTEVMARLCHNNHRSYSLQSCAERMGKSKIKEAVDFVKKHDHDYTKLPEDLLVKYVEMDSELSADLFVEQRKTLQEWQQNSDIKPGFVVNLELRTTKNLHIMQSQGLSLNVPYCKEAMEYEKQRIEDSKEEFKRLTGQEFVDSRKALEPIFKANNLPFAVTEKGNSSFAADALILSGDNPIVRCIQNHRDSNKRVSTYWSNLIALSIDGFIYPNIRQAGTATGRFSSWEPNLQNLTDDSDSAYPIRRAFVARPNHKLVSIDYAQMELRHIADEADEMNLIRQIQEGVDFHQRVANIAGVPRSLAKNVRFARLYGAGAGKIARMLKLENAAVRRTIEAIDSTAPRINEYSYALIRDVKARGYGYNAYGRRYFFDRGFEYKAPNFRCQGSCSDILRIAIDKITAFLHGKSSKLLLPIHDELVFDIPEHELGIIPEIKRIMIEAHTERKHLDFDVAVHVGDNLHDMEEMKLWQ